MRIAVAGFQHETNTFAPLRASWQDFVQADAWPALTQGPDIPTAFAGLNLPIAGFMRAASAADHALRPLAWSSAEPSAFVSDDAFDRMTTLLIDGLGDAGAVDALYLDLHGAMVTETHDDGEGALLAALRGVTGPSLPIVVSLDLHANITPRMVQLSDAIAVYRTYPHLDMAATGERCMALLERLVREGKPAKAFRQASFLTPLHAQCTGHAPNDRLFGGLSERCSGDVWSVDIGAGFPAADIHHCGPTVVAYAGSQAGANAAADRLLDAFEAAEPEFVSTALPAAEAVRRALDSTGAGPCVLADIQDNPGAGGTSDTTGLLQALIDARATGAFLGVLHDPEVAACAHAAGVGGEFDARLGGKLGGPGDGSVHARFQVRGLSDGVFPFTGEMYAGATAHLGATAWLRVTAPECDVHVLVGSERCQCVDLATFRHIGIEPASARLLVVKSTVHFRADFEPIAQAVWAVIAAGANPCELNMVRYRHLRAGVRRGPSGPRQGDAHALPDSPAAE